MSFLQIPIQTYPNTSLGYQSSISTTSGTGNTALGDSTLILNQAGSGNVAIGASSLYTNNSGDNNTSVGTSSMFANLTGQQNAAFGHFSLQDNTSGGANTAIGGYALRRNNGTLNTAVGYNSGYNITTGSKNSILGSYNGNQGGLDIRTLSNHIVLSDGDGNPRLWINASGAANIPGGLALTGSLSITGGTVTANNPVLSATQTWNNAAVTFTGWQLNVTDTASNAASLLMDLQVGGVSQFSVSKIGLATAANLTAQSIIRNTAGIYCDNNSIRTAASGYFGWASSGGAGAGSPDLFLYRDAANTLAQRNGVNAQTLRVYNTFTDASNYERGRFAWVSNVLTIGTENAGTGLARALEIQTAGTTRAILDTNGNVIINTAGIATNATNGFLYVAGCAGTPTGTPTAYTGRVPIVVDTTNNKLYFYSGGAWRDAGP